MGGIKIRGESGAVYSVQIPKGEDGAGMTHAFAHNNFSVALKGSGEGNPVVVADAVGEVLVNVDVGGATVTKYGKNLLDLSQTTNRTRCTYNAETNEFTSNIIDSYYCSITTRQLNDILLASKGKSFTFSVGKGNEDKGTILVIYGTRTDGKEYQDVDSGLKPYVTVTVAEEFTAIDRVTLRFNQHAKKSTDTTTVLSDFQFEFGDTATEYEPYQAPTTITADEDGVVHGITAQGETMTLLADDGATITAEYNRDINKVIDKLYAALT